MNRSNVIPALLLFTATTLGCSGPITQHDDDEQLGSTSSATFVSVVAHERFNVMTRNVYLGADLDPILNAGSVEEVPGLVAAAWAQMVGNEPAARANAIGGEIAYEAPQLVGLQEMAIFRRFPASGGAPEEIDMLALLQSNLAARGVDYQVAVTQNDSEVWVPMFAGFDATGAPIIDTVQMVDREAILTQNGVGLTISQPTSGRYVRDLPLSVGGVPVSIVRGWVSVVVTTPTDRPARFVSTHLEDYSAEVQVAQANELITLLAPERLPTILVGDFNSPADGSGTPTYGLVTDAGYNDVWARVWHTPGYTCCGPADLHEAATFTERIDLVLVRDRGKAIQGFRTAILVGTKPTSTGLWPSDHAGIVSSFRLP